MFVLHANVIFELNHVKPHQFAMVRTWSARQPSSRLFMSEITWQSR